MGRIIHLNGDPHERAQRLLPWYVNGTLDPAETTAVEAHLAQCAECRAELETDRALKTEIANLPIGIEPGWASLQEKLKAREAKRAGAARGLTPSFLRRPIPLGWALTAQAAALALMVGVVRLAGPAQPVYQTLSAPAAAPRGNLMVIFQPDTTEQDFRTILARNNARLVDGPTVSDAYVLRVAADQRASVLAQLRHDPSIVLAEPIDGDVQR